MLPWSLSSKYIESSYLVAISTEQELEQPQYVENPSDIPMSAHLPLTLMFQRIYDSDAIGDPIHLASANIVDTKALLSNGA